MDIGLFIRKEKLNAFQMAAKEMNIKIIDVLCPNETTFIIEVEYDNPHKLFELGVMLMRIDYERKKIANIKGIFNGTEYKKGWKTYYGGGEIFVNGEKISRLHYNVNATSAYKYGNFKELPNDDTDLVFIWGENSNRPLLLEISLAILMQFYSYDQSIKYYSEFLSTIISSLEKSQDFNIDINIGKWMEEIMYEEMLQEEQEESVEPYHERGEDDLYFDELRRNRDRDYFDAMTDGQLGDYNDFIERGGDTDSISDWAGR